MTTDIATDKTAIRDASTVIVLRDRDSAPQILMGQRGANAAFMPNKVVFPGGAVDLADADIPLATAINPACATRLGEQSAGDRAHALAAAAIRELWEETGQILGQSGDWTQQPHPDWADFAARGFVPTAHPLQFVFRAITPPGRPRRFDARFFLVDADDLASDPDDFSAACEELSHLQWVPLKDVRDFDLPFITEVVLAEIAGRVTDRTAPKSVPFFRNDDEQSLFLRLRGEAQSAD